MAKLIGYARVSTKGQNTDRQEQDLLASGVRKDDLYVDRGVSGSRDKRPALDTVREALHTGDTLVVCTLDRLGRSTQHMLALADELKAQGVNLRILNLGGGDVDTGSPMGQMMFVIMTALAEMELAIKRERIQDSVAKRKDKGGDLGGRRETIAEATIRNAVTLIESGKPAAQVARELNMSRATLYRRMSSLT